MVFFRQEESPYKDIRSVLFENNDVFAHLTLGELWDRVASTPAFCDQSISEIRLVEGEQHFYVTLKAPLPRGNKKDRGYDKDLALLCRVQHELSSTSTGHGDWSTGFQFGVREDDIRGYRSTVLATSTGCRLKFYHILVLAERIRLAWPTKGERSSQMGTLFGTQSFAVVLFGIVNCFCDNPFSTIHELEELRKAVPCKFEPKGREKWRVTQAYWTEQERRLNDNLNFSTYHIAKYFYELFGRGDEIDQLDYFRHLRDLEGWVEAPKALPALHVREDGHILFPFLTHSVPECPFALPGADKPMASAREAVPRAVVRLRDLQPLTERCQLVSIKRYATARITRHQYLVACAKLPTFPSPPRVEYKKEVGRSELVTEDVFEGFVWLRMERIAELTKSSLLSVGSVWPAEDTIGWTVMKSNPELQEGELVASFEFSDPQPESKDRRAPTLYDLSNVLEIVVRNAPRYSLGSENCWFFAAVLQEALEEFDPWTPRVGWSVTAWNAIMAWRTRRKILKQSRKLLPPNVRQNLKKQRVIPEAEASQALLGVKKVDGQTAEENDSDEESTSTQAPSVDAARGRLVTHDTMVEPEPVTNAHGSLEEPVPQPTEELESMPTLDHTQDENGTTLSRYQTATGSEHASEENEANETKPEPAPSPKGRLTWVQVEINGMMKRRLRRA